MAGGLRHDACMHIYVNDMPICFLLYSTGQSSAFCLQKGHYSQNVYVQSM